MLQVATYNIHHGTKRQKLGENILALQQSGCNVLCLQEVYCNDQDSYVGDYLLSLLPNSWTYTYFHEEEHPFGLAIYWDQNQLTHQRTDRLTLPAHPRQTWIEYLWAGNSVQKRGALSVVFNQGDQTFRVTNTHLDWQGGYRHRIDQLQTLVESLDTSRVPHVLCGDLNTCGPSLFYRRYQHKLAGVLESFQDAVAHISWSYDIRSINALDSTPTRFLKLARALGFKFRQRLDHLYYHGCTLIDSRRVDLMGSDHYPLVAHWQLD